MRRFGIKFIKFKYLTGIFAVNVAMYLANAKKNQKKYAKLFIAIFIRSEIICNIVIAKMNNT